MIAKDGFKIFFLSRKGKQLALPKKSDADGGRGKRTAEITIASGGGRESFTATTTVISSFDLRGNFIVVKQKGKAELLRRKLRDWGSRYVGDCVRNMLTSLHKLLRQIDGRKALDAFVVVQR